MQVKPTIFMLNFSYYQKIPIKFKVCEFSPSAESLFKSIQLPILCIWKCTFLSSSDDVNNLIDIVINNGQHRVTQKIMLYIDDVSLERVSSAKFRGVVDEYVVFCKNLSLYPHTLM